MKKNSNKNRDKETEELPSATTNDRPVNASSDVEKVIAEIYGLLEEIKQHKNALKKKGIL